MRLKGTTWDLQRGYDRAATFEVYAPEIDARVEWGRRWPPDTADDQIVDPAKFSDFMGRGDPHAGQVANGETIPRDWSVEALEPTVAGTAHGAIVPPADAGAL